MPLSTPSYGVTVAGVSESRCQQFACLWHLCLPMACLKYHSSPYRPLRWGRVCLHQLSPAWCCCVLRPWEQDPKSDPQNNSVSSGMWNHRTVARSLGSMLVLQLTGEPKRFGPWDANWLWSWQHNPIGGGGVGAVAGKWGSGQIQIRGAKLS